jgi:hypothetical protein
LKPLCICPVAEYVSEYSSGYSRPRRGKEDTFVKCLLGWSRFQVHPPKQVLETRVVAEGVDAGFKWLELHGTRSGKRLRVGDF